MYNKGFVNNAVIIGAVIFVGILGYIIVNQRLSSSAPISTPTPTLSITPYQTPKPILMSSPESSPVSNSNSVPYKADGTCPSGYVDYGVPLQCVSPEYMDFCKSHLCPICLSENAQIDTPLGAVIVKDLQIGMPIWTVDYAGHRVWGIVQKTSRVPVPLTHEMVHLILKDRRELLVSPGHPTIDGRRVGDLSPDDLYNGVLIVSVNRVPYRQLATYDILPSGETAFYWANGILLDSTLH